MTNDRQARAARAEKMRKERDKADRRQRSTITVAIVTIVVVLIVAAGWGVTKISSQNEKNTEVIEPRNLTEGGFQFAGANPVADDAPIVETFEDFLCSHCGEFEASTGQFLKQQAEVGAIDLRFMPMTIQDGLDKLGRPAQSGPAHDTMNAAVCAADEQGKEAFWAVHTALFQAEYYSGAAQPSASGLVAVTEEAGVTGLDSCIRSGKFVPWLNQAREAAEERGVTGTPSIFVGGKATDGISKSDLDEAIAAARKSG